MSHAELGTTAFGHTMRPHWSLDPPITFLNHGSYGATPRVVQAAQQRWRDRLEAEPVRFMSDELPPALDAALASLATFVGVSRDNIVLVENATAGANAVLRSIDWQRGDRVVIANHGYPALKNTLRYLAQTRGIEVIEAPLPWPITDATQIVDAYVGALDGARLVVIDHIFSPLAFAIPDDALAAILDACRARGVKVLVDGAHAPALLPLQLDALVAQGMDWYVGNCHKWLCAPKGAGFLYAAPHAQAGLHPTVISNYFGEGFQREFAWCGTADPSARLCVPDAIAFLNGLGLPRYRSHLKTQAADAARLIADAWQVQLGAPLDWCPSMVTIPLPIDEAASAEGVARWRNRLLAEHRIEVPIHPLAGRLWVRISAQVYNELSDYEALARAALTLR
ncbi:MAG: aminotransferase class V-fold PLP-dependent enzyme [Nitrosomonadaceae bacterium]|nr:aminotransferase class V-fold PLP-dependent enzyme [Nitrosomonadaceae bacterium]